VADRDDDALRAHALALNERYVREVVLAFGLCPWAEAAYRDGHVERHVVLDAEPAPEAVLAFLDHILPRTDIEIGLLIFPRIGLDSPSWDRFVESARRADRARRGGGETAAPFVLAPFHPAAPAGTKNPWQFVSFVRRTPHPTIQVVRLAVLDAVKRGAPDLSDDVTRANFARLGPEGAARLEAAIAAIAAARSSFLR